ncbi:hypothetical protein [Gillisia sp. JM1]|uniref:hypothetical protein n=1 Tax=Gillisia sp. JM1 TaxID=1283286 RepID=UPI000411E199|nr:hypothetical protein [Gillisia sp. JM1]
MSKKDEINKLKKKYWEQGFVKDFQQNILTDMELITRDVMSKKNCPNHEIPDRKKETKAFRKMIIRLFGLL